MTITNKVTNRSMMPGITPISDVPDTPTIGSPSNAQSSSLDIAFTAAATGGTATIYRALSTPGSITATSTTSPITVSGLSTATSYVFQVRAENSTGNSTYSQASTALSTISLPNNYTSIQTATVDASGASTITFSSIPNTYTHLQIRGILRNTAGGAGSLDLWMNFNGDNNTNYRAYKQIGGDGSSAFSAASGTSTAATNRIANGYHLNDGNTADVYNAWICDILDYKNTNKYKVTRCIGGQDLNGSGFIRLYSGLWMSTSAINSIVLTVEGGNNFKQYTQFALYGVK